MSHTSKDCWGKEQRTKPLIASQARCISAQLISFWVSAWWFHSLPLNTCDLATASCTLAGPEWLVPSWGIATCGTGWPEVGALAREVVGKALLERCNYSGRTLESCTHCWMTSWVTKLLVEQPYLTSCHLLIVTHNTRSCVALRCRLLCLWMLCQVWDKVLNTHLSGVGKFFAPSLQVLHCGVQPEHGKPDSHRHWK